MLRRLLAAWVGNWAGERIVRLKVSLHSICTFMHPVGYFRFFVVPQVCHVRKDGEVHRGADRQDGLGQVGWDILCLVWRQLLLVRLGLERMGVIASGQTQDLRP